MSAICKAIIDPAMSAMQSWAAGEVSKPGNGASRDFDSIVNISAEAACEVLENLGPLSAVAHLIKAARHAVVACV
ncbi:MULTISPECIES: hypothetical protein [unclassified Rhizobium]|uniref:hypothetical protein n=1 Tax=unclassified Rhizobium TaxID=2613769 RepID=UPI0037FAA530